MKILSKPDPVSRYHGFCSCDDVVKRYVLFRFHPLVPELIQDYLKAVHRLLLFSYYETAFIDIAFARALQIFEMSLRVRQIEIEGNPVVSASKKSRQQEPTLWDLIKWANGRELLERSEDYAQSLRTLRNLIAHAKSRESLSTGSIKIIYSIVDFINDLYEDVEARKKRRLAMREVHEALTTIVASGAYFADQNHEQVLAHAEVICCVADGSEFALHIAFIPIFDAQGHNGSFDLPDPIFKCFCEYQLGSNFINFINVKGEKVSIRPITNDGTLAKYRQFHAEYQKHGIFNIALQMPIVQERRKIVRSTMQAGAFL